MMADTFDGGVLARHEAACEEARQESYRRARRLYQAIEARWRQMALDERVRADLGRASGMPRLPFIL